MCHTTAPNTKQKARCEGVSIDYEGRQTKIRIHNSKLSSANPHINSMEYPNKHL